MLQIKSPNILLYGDSGSGKSTSIKTLCACPEIKHVRVLATESQTLTRLREVPVDRLDWKLIAPMQGSGAALLKRVKTLTKMQWNSAKDSADPDKGDHDQLVEVLNALHNDFVGDRTGKSYGPITEWEPDTALVLDTLTGLGQFCLAAVCGIAVVRTQPQWYAAMELEKSTLSSIVNDTNAWVIVLGHDDAYKTGTGILHDITALGQKNAPLVKRMFGEIIYAYKLTETGKVKYLWTNTRADTQTKPGILPAGDAHPQDFKLIVTPYYNSIKPLVESDRTSAPTATA